VNLIALLLGAVAIFSPVIGLILMLMYCSLSLRNNSLEPLRILGLVVAAPILFAAVYRTQPGSLLVASDALGGASLAALVFLFSLRRSSRPVAALANSALVIVAYGLLRHLAFGAYLEQTHEQAMNQLATGFPQLWQAAQTQESLTLMRYLIPAGWMLPQLGALLAGTLLFLHLGGVRLSWPKLSFPTYYNLALLAILPLYLFPQLRLLFVNALLALCVLPLVQGIGVISHFLSRYASNILAMVLAIILIVLNLVLVTLLGFADIWLDFRKLKNKGTLA